MFIMYIVVYVLNGSGMFYEKAFLDRDMKVKNQKSKHEYDPSQSHLR